MTVIIVMVFASIQPLEWSNYLLHQVATVLLVVVLAAYRYWHHANKKSAKS